MSEKSGGIFLTHTVVYVAQNQQQQKHIYVKYRL